MPMQMRMGMLAVVGIMVPLCGAAQTPQPPVRVGGAVRAPTKIVDAQPVYPEVAANAHVSGVVILELTVDATGHVQDAHIVRGVPLLDQAAIDAVRQWQFTPTLLNGVPTPVILTATVNFAPPGGEPGEPVPPPGLLSDEEARRQPFLIASGRAGVFQIGMPVEMLYRRIPPDQTTLVDLKTEGFFTPAIAIRLEPDATKPAIIAAYRQDGSRWVVEWLYIDDPRFRTPDGLGVGSTLADIQAVSPDARPQQGEGTFVLLRDRWIWFRLEADTVTRVSLRAPLPAVGRIRP